MIFTESERSKLVEIIGKSAEYWRALAKSRQSPQDIALGLKRSKAAGSKVGKQMKVLPEIYELIRGGEHRKARAVAKKAGIPVKRVTKAIEDVRQGVGSKFHDPKAYEKKVMGGGSRMKHTRLKYMDDYAGMARGV